MQTLSIDHIEGEWEGTRLKTLDIDGCAEDLSAVWIQLVQGKDTCRRRLQVDEEGRWHAHLDFGDEASFRVDALLGVHLESDEHPAQHVMWEGVLNGAVREEPDDKAVREREGVRIFEVEPTSTEQWAPRVEIKVHPECAVETTRTAAPIERTADGEDRVAPEPASAPTATQRAAAPARQPAQQNRGTADSAPPRAPDRLPPSWEDAIAVMREEVREEVRRATDELAARGSTDSAPTREEAAQEETEPADAAAARSAPWHAAAEALTEEVRAEVNKVVEEGRRHLNAAKEAALRRISEATREGAPGAARNGQATDAHAATRAPAPGASAAEAQEDADAEDRPAAAAAPSREGRVDAMKETLRAEMEELIAQARDRLYDTAQQVVFRIREQERPPHSAGSDRQEQEPASQQPAQAPERPAMAPTDDPRGASSTQQPSAPPSGRRAPAAAEPDRSRGGDAPPATIACPAVHFEPVRLGGWDEDRRQVKLQATVLASGAGQLSALLRDNETGEVLEEQQSRTGMMKLRHRSAYAPGEYTVAVEIAEPAGCPSTSYSFTVPEPEAAPAEAEGEDAGAEEDPEEPGLMERALAGAWAVVLALYLLVLAMGARPLFLGISAAVLAGTAALFLAYGPRRHWARARWTYVGLALAAIGGVVLVTYTSLVRMDMYLLAAGIAAGGFLAAAVIGHLRS